MPQTSRTLIVSANAVPGTGGQGQNLLHMVQAYRDLLQLSVFCQGDRLGLAGESVAPSSIARTLSRIPVLRRRADWLMLASDLHFDAHVSRRLPPAALFQGVVGQSLFSLRAARRKRMGTVLDVVNTHIADLAEQVARECAVFGTRSFLGAPMQLRVRGEYEAADVIRVMSEHAKRTFVDHGVAPDKVVVATPPVDLREFPQANFESSVFRICFVGLLQPWKGFHYLIEAYERLQLRDSELVLWGGSGSRPVTRYLSEKRARNAGIVIRPEEVRRIGYGAVYGSSSVLVHPSLTDGFGYVVAEAMASGIPVIVSRNAGASDLVVDGENGYVVPPRDSVAIEERLRHLAAHPDLVRRMGAAARQTAAGLTIERFRGELVRRMQELGGLT